MIRQTAAKNETGADADVAVPSPFQQSDCQRGKILAPVHESNERTGHPIDFIFFRAVIDADDFIYRIQLPSVAKIDIIVLSLTAMVPDTGP